MRLPSETEDSAAAAVLERLPDARRAVPHAEIAQLIADIQRYFAGEKLDFGHVPVDLGSQSAFFSQVYAEVRKLGWGQTTTYGAVARLLGAEPQMAREVGQAMAGNPVPLIIPCHRVLAAGNKLGGFSAPGGTSSKARMLQIEGVSVAGEQAAAVAREARKQIGFGF